jgi:5-methylcytosine-specific restriction endonuclease McrA
MTADAGERGAIAFAEKVLQLLDEGRYTATYKYAVLIALMDLVLEHTSRAGNPPDVLTTRQLAEKIVEVYWPQTRPFARGAEAKVLAQNLRGQAEILADIIGFRARCGLDPAAPLWEARRADAHGFGRLVERVEWKLIEMPLPRLQAFGTAASEFIYTIGWGASVRAADVRRYQRGTRSSFDNRILLKPGVGWHLKQLNGVLRPLIQRQWAAMVGRLNHHDDTRLEAFLFGADRAMTGRVRRAVWEIQLGRCFYCQAPTAPDESELDHFIPWTRYPDDGLDNLVLVDERCNRDKRAFLAAADHVSRWVPRLHESSPDGVQIEDAAQRVGWLRLRSRTLGVARAIYLGLPADAKLWLRGRRFVDADRDTLAALLGVN